MPLPLLFGSGAVPKNDAPVAYLNDVPGREGRENQRHAVSILDVRRETPSVGDIPEL
jgi:hypothetical protein